MSNLSFYRFNPQKLFLITTLVLLFATFVFPSVAYAAFNNEAFEAESYYSYGGAKNGTFSLTYMGRGGGNCDRDDYRFRINVNSSYLRSDWKFYSSNSTYNHTPSGRPIYGFQLDTGNAHICVGMREMTWWLGGNWTVDGVQRNVYTWRR